MIMLKDLLFCPFLVVYLVPILIGIFISIIIARSRNFLYIILFILFTYPAWAIPFHYFPKIYNKSLANLLTEPLMVGIISSVILIIQAILFKRSTKKICVNKKMIWIACLWITAIVLSFLIGVFLPGIPE